MNSRSFKNIEQPTIAQKIVDQICQAIADGRYRPGDQLPTEMELAQMFNVGRNSVREAIKILEAYGLLEIRRAEGTFVTQGISKALVNPLIYGVILNDNDTVGEMIEFQIMLDKATSQLCAMKCTDEDKAHLTQAYQKLETELYREPYQMEAVHATDRAFHDLIIEYTHNEFAKIVNNAIWSLLDTTIKKEVESIMENDPKHMQVLHKQIYDAIMRGDGNAAADAVPPYYYIDKHHMR